MSHWVELGKEVNIKTMTTDEPTLVEVPTVLLAEMPTILADLYRETRDYQVRVIYFPDLKAPEGAHITILDRKNEIIDELDLAAEDGFKAFLHPTGFSTTLTMYMRGIEAERH